MNVVLQRHGARHIYVVPEGLRELMSDITREVLRALPEHMYGFIADYLDAMMITRENARVAASVVESLTDCSVTIAELLQRTGMSRTEANKNANIIQKAFRNYVARKKYPKTQDAIGEANLIEEILDQLHVSKEKVASAAQVIQTAYRAFKERQEIFADDQEFINWRIAMHNTMFIYRRTGISDEVANRAATTIKAAYRGYYTRRYLKRQHESLLEKVSQEITASDEMMEEEQTTPDLSIQYDFDPNDKQVMDAIIYIQYYVRRFLRRTEPQRIVRDIMMSIAKFIIPSATDMSDTVSDARLSFVLDTDIGGGDEGENNNYDMTQMDSDFDEEVQTEDATAGSSIASEV